MKDIEKISIMPYHFPWNKREDESMSENNNDFLANNNGIIKTKKGLVLAIGVYLMVA